MEENNKGIRERQYKTALAERRIYHMVGAPNLRNFKIMIRKNIIHNLTVTVEDIVIEENIFGTYVSTLKGRTTRQRPKVFVDYFIEIPR